jgi:hypothetical protein
MTVHWRKCGSVTAVRLDRINISEVADLIGAQWGIPREGEGGDAILWKENHVAREGDWVSFRSDGKSKFYTDKEFQEKYQTLPEVLSEDDRVESAYKIVIEAMLSARKDSASSLEQTAMAAVKSILDV